MDKTIAADLSSGEYAMLISVTWTKKTQNSLPCHKFCQKLANSDGTKETPNCTASVAAGSIVDAISFIRHTVLWCENKFSPRSDQIRSWMWERFEFWNPARSCSGRIWNNQIWYISRMYRACGWLIWHTRSALLLNLPNPCYCTVCSANV